MEIRLSVELANLIGMMKSHGMSDEEILESRRRSESYELPEEENPLLEVSLDYLRKALEYGYEIAEVVSEKDKQTAEIIENYERYIGRAVIELEGGKLGTLMMFSDNKQLVKINGNWHPVEGLGVTWGLLYTNEEMEAIEEIEQDFETEWFDKIVEDAKNLYADMTKMDNNEPIIYNAHKGEMIMSKGKEPVVPMKIKKKVAEMAKFCGRGTELNENDLLLLIDMALTTKDKEWFDELTAQLKAAK